MNFNDAIQHRSVERLKPLCRADKSSDFFGSFWGKAICALFEPLQTRSEKEKNRFKLAGDGKATPSPGGALNRV
jgi:hypothetical protein